MSSKTILKQLRDATKSAGEERLGLRAECIGTHSIRSGAAMAMYLAGVPSETIQLVGRWRSRTFMRYLRIQVPDSTLGVTARMTNRQTFYTIATDTADERQPENGGNQVDSQQRDGPPYDANKWGRHGKMHQERETKLLGPDSEAIYLYLPVGSAIWHRERNSSAQWTIRQYTANDDTIDSNNRPTRLNGLRDIRTRLGIYFVDVDEDFNRITPTQRNGWLRS